MYTIYVRQFYVIQYYNISYNVSINDLCLIRSIISINRRINEKMYTKNINKY